MVDLAKRYREKYVKQGTKILLANGEYVSVDELIEDYYQNDMKKLRVIIDQILNKSQFIGMNKDDFYSLANELFMRILVDYDNTRPFEGFLYSCLVKKFDSELTRRGRDKRSNNIKIPKTDEQGNVIRDGNGDIVYVKTVIQDDSLDRPIGDDEKATIGDLVQSDFNLDTELSEKIDFGHSERVEKFLKNLSGISKKIAELIMLGFSVSEIKEKLELTDKQYQKSWDIINSYENRRILYNENKDMEEKEMGESVFVEDIAERYKDTSYSIAYLSKALRKRRIRDDHILQRHSGQWKSYAKSELISDILRGKSLTQIIISEEIKNGVKMQWLIDGKQRCTTLDDYLHDGFAISKNVKNYLIKYQVPKLDENGDEVFNEEGFPVIEFHEFDIRGKKYSQLPEELKDVFQNRQIPTLYNLNCTKKDIAEDIARFNRSRPMNAAQNGWLGLDEDFAELVKNISRMQFFQPDFNGSNYTKNNHTASAIERIIVESIMVSDFIDDFSKNFNKMCEFLSEEGSDSNFTEFYTFVERLTQISNEEFAVRFNAKDSFLWFGLFSRFTKLGLDDKCFADFIAEFNKTLHSKKIEDRSFDDLSVGSTKDKNIVIAKMDHLETLMNEFLHINKEEVLNEFDVPAGEIDKYIAEIKESDIVKTLKIDNNTDLVRVSLKTLMSIASGIKTYNDADIQEFMFNGEVSTENMDDTLLYLDVLNDWSLEIDNNSMVLSKENVPVLSKVIQYSYDNDLDEKLTIQWFSTFADKYKDGGLPRDEMEKYKMMTDSLDSYIKKRGASQCMAS